MISIREREVYRLIFFRWLFLGGALFYLVLGNLNYVDLPLNISDNFILLVFSLTGLLALNLLWFVIIFSLGQPTLGKFAWFLSIVSVFLDTFLILVGIALLGTVLPLGWLLLLVPIALLSGISETASFILLGGVVLLMHTVIKEPYSFDLNLSFVEQLIFILIALPIILKGGTGERPVYLGAHSDYNFFRREKKERGARERAASETGKLDEMSRRLYAKDLEVKLIKQELATLEEAKSKFIAVTAHQMRTPLSAIKWTFNMLKEGSLGALSSDQAQFVGKGEQATENMIKIVNNLVTVDSIMTIDKTAHLEPLSLHNLLTEVIAEFSNQSKSRDLTLKFVEPTGAIPSVPADYPKLKMVIENLIDNAIKYSNPHTAITVTLSDELLNTANSSLVIKVADQGIGIPKEDQGRIYTKFHRAQNAVAKEPNGSGVGLFIAKDIIEGHGGSLRFESKEGQGTTFIITLPLKTNP